MTELQGAPGVPGPVGTAPHIGRVATVAGNIEGAAIYGDAMLRWLFAKMEEEQDPRRLGRVETFIEHGYADEMQKHFARLAHHPLSEFSEEDRKIYYQVSRLFSFLSGMTP